jgi:hypothetical protein
MNVDTATAYINDAKAQDIEVTVILTDGTEAIGDPISVNSKGVNIKVGGKVRSFGLKRVDSLVSDMDVDDEVDFSDDNDEEVDFSDSETDEDIYAMLGDGMTTAELADHLSDALKVDMTPKELRVHLRALGLGVGKGRKYSLTATEYRMVKDLITTPATV